jgi:hypothetical protein
LCRRYLIENCTGTLKLIAACFISGGKAGNGWARRSIANVSPSSAACPDDPDRRQRLPEKRSAKVTLLMGTYFAIR